MGNQSQKLKKILVFSAHPDDHLCCAGTLMWLKTKGFEIHEIVATGGEKGPWWISEKTQRVGFSQKDLKKERKKEIDKASKIIGINRISFLGLSDGEITIQTEIIEKIMKLVRRERPTIVFTTSPKDYHRDHRQLGKIVLEAVNQASWSFRFELGKPYRVPTVLFMEGFYFGEAHLVVDITPFAERKRALMETYKSQIPPREKKLLESMNFYRAFLMRNERVWEAEAFEIPENFPIHLNQLIEIFT